MDDMYQYAASAVNSNNKQPTDTVSEEDDVILKAFSNMGWGKKWSSLVDTVKKQGEAFVEVTKKDLQEFAQVLTEDDPEESNQDGAVPETTAEGSDRQANSANGPSPLDSIRENLSKINTVNFSSLRQGLTDTLNQTLPTQITSVRLPENMDLTQLKEGLEKGTRSAEHYLQKFGTDVIFALKGTVTVLEPEEAAGQEQTGQGTTSTKPRIFATRKESMLAKMQSNEATYLSEPETSNMKEDEQEQERKVLETFNSTFKIDEYTEEIARLLEYYPDLREMMDKLVPVQVSYTLFWQRYFYSAWKIDQDEQKRQLIVQGATGHDEEEEGFKWDSDEEETNNHNTSTPLVATVSSISNNSNNTTTTASASAIQEENPVDASITSISSGNSGDKKKKEPVEKEEEPKKRISTSNSEDTDDFSHISQATSSASSPPLKSSQTEDEWVKAEKKKENEGDDSDSDWE